jgi:dTDP-4-dehydrorhamnose reductase
MVMKILITGASGLLGSKLAELAISLGYDVYSCYNQHMPEDGVPIKLDVADWEMVKAVLERVMPDVIIHSAAVTNVDLCERNRELAFKVNVVGTRNLVEFAGGSYFIYISTDYVFDGEKGLYKEGDIPNPINYYGYTKFEAEKLVINSGLDYLIVRPSVIYGSRPASGKTNFALWLIDMLSKGNEVRLLTDQYVSPTLNTNLASMILEAIRKGLTGVFHMSGGERISRFDFGIKLAEVFGFNPELIKKANMSQMNWIAKRPRDSSLDVSKACGVLKNKPLKVYESLKILKRELEDASRY